MGQKVSKKSESKIVLSNPPMDDISIACDGMPMFADPGEVAMNLVGVNNDDDNFVIHVLQNSYPYNVYNTCATNTTISTDPHF